MTNITRNGSSSGFVFTTGGSWNALLQQHGHVTPSNGPSARHGLDKEEEERRFLERMVEDQNETLGRR